MKNHIAQIKSVTVLLGKGIAFRLFFLSPATCSKIQKRNYTSFLNGISNFVSKIVIFLFLLIPGSLIWYVLGSNTVAFLNFIITLDVHYVEY